MNGKDNFKNTQKEKENFLNSKWNTFNSQKMTLLSALNKSTTKQWSS
jgi:hypothetical protein